MELFSSASNVTFQALQVRLITFVNTRIQNGDFSERGLAKILGISQPQIHNVLKGARRLRPELADRLIRKLEMSVLDLLEPSEIYEELLSRGTVEVGSASQVLSIGQHIPPTKFGRIAGVKKPASREVSGLKARAAKAS